MDDFTQIIDGFVSGEDIAAPLDFLIARLPDVASPYIVGGALRNFLILRIYGASPKTEDIDVVIGGLGGDDPMEIALAGEDFARGDFDGFKWRPKYTPYSFDLSLLENFLPIKKYRLAPTVENLLDTVDFTVNALIWDVKAKVLYERNATRAIRERTIGFNSEKVYDIGFLAYRLLLIRHKIGFWPSEGAFRFLRTALDLEDIVWIEKTLRARHGRKFAEKILEDFDRICCYSDYREYKKREKPPEYMKNALTESGDIEP